MAINKSNGRSRENDGDEKGNGEISAVVISIDDGVPVRGQAEVNQLTCQGATVKVDKPLKKGQSIVLIIKNVNSDIIDKLEIDDKQFSMPAIIKTQGKVNTVESEIVSSYVCTAQIDFIGNIKISNDLE